MADTPLCRSDYYRDTGRRRGHGDRLIRCGLPKHSRDTDHAEIDYAGEVMHTWAWAPEPQPRTWELTPEPGPGVTKVRCHCHGVWERGEATPWIDRRGHLWLAVDGVDRVTTWPGLLLAHTDDGHPLTDATREEGDI